MARPRRDQMALFHLGQEMQAAEQEINFICRVFAQTSLPYKDPGPDKKIWGRRNGNVSLFVQPGWRPLADGTAESYGFPYGSMPRLLLPWLSTEAVRNKSQVLDLGDSLRGFMKALGLPTNGGKTGTMGRFKEQAQRLFSAQIVVHWHDQELDGTTETRLQVASSYSLWGQDAPGQQGLFPNVVKLSTDFYKEIIAHPVPFDIVALKALRGSPLRLDLYWWLTYRLWKLEHPITVKWTSLMEQFGSTYADTSSGRAKFRNDLAKHLKEVRYVYPDANVDLTEHGLLLRYSPPSVPTREMRALGM